MTTELEEMLSGVERLANAASRGPWFTDKDKFTDEEGWVHTVFNESVEMLITVPYDGDEEDQVKADTAFIAYCGTFALSLVAKVREMAEELRVTRRALELATKDARYTFNIREGEYLRRAKKEEVSDGE